MSRSWWSWLLDHFTDISHEGRSFDETWGTRTCAFDLGNYEPTRPSVVTSALDAVDLGPQGASFVDLGSGKGRVALMASQRPYDRVVGVEHRQRLHQVAQENLASFRSRGGCTCEVHLMCADAANQPLPEGPLVLFVFNSFPPNVLVPLLQRVAGCGVDARLVYVNPQHDGVVSALGWRCVAMDDTSEDPGWEWRIYAVPGGRP